MAKDPVELPDRSEVFRFGGAGTVLLLALLLSLAASLMLGGTAAR